MQEDAAASTTRCRARERGKGEGLVDLVKDVGAGPDQDMIEDELAGPGDLVQDAGVGPDQNVIEDERAGPDQWVANCACARRTKTDIYEVV